MLEIYADNFVKIFNEMFIYILRDTVYDSDSYESYTMTHEARL